MKFRTVSYITSLIFAGLVVASCGHTRKSTSSPARISDDSLLTLVEYKTFRYFWDGAEPVSGMARERYHMDGVYPENDFSVVTTGGTGFGLMSIIVGIERKFITREQGYERISHIVKYLSQADRFHGAWPHWLYGETGRVKPFGQKDNGADIVETSYLTEGLLTARQYFKDGNEKERRLAASIDSLWRGVDWNFFTRGGTDGIYWHWSPDYAWAMNFPIKGYNECLITYVLAASSPTFPVDPAVYHKGWARNGDIVSKQVTYGLPLLLKHNDLEEYGGPLFWSHYTYLGLDPHGLSDTYADYWKVNLNQSLINYKWCVLNPEKFKGYSSECWGLTSSYSLNGYSAHAPGKIRDMGVISPTAAISSLPYTPEQSMAALKYFYYSLGDRIFGEYGFFDAFSIENEWYPEKYLAIDQGPEVVMIENYRTGLLWKLFMSSPEVQTGLKKLGFSSPWLQNEDVK
ncbi:MAG TPA: glucoamylase family protein [Bacteroidales bacterium]|nr:glucoamylase family protein [Bacteroidales bacterium]